MIPRYSRPEMLAIWSDQTRFEIWLEVETLALEGMVKAGLAPQSALDAIRTKGNFNVERVLEIEEEVKHDVIAFLTNVTEYAGPDAKFMHRGLTSNDLLDTTMAVQLKRAGKIILKGLDEAIESVKKRAIEHKFTPTVGRSHGIHAEPTSFGLKLISWYSELKRQKKRLLTSLESVCVGKIAGPVGTYASIPPQVEDHVFSILGIKAETVPSQIVHRDRHAEFFCALAQLATSIERACVEIRHLQRSEVHEVEEPFGSGQKGSSAMPHKKNPILTENLTGLARVVRGYAQTALENVALWHERDISHSSAERVIAPDACVLLDFMLARFKRIVDGLVILPEQMLKNMELSRGLVYSGSLLLSLVDSGVIREDAYRLVQKHALPTWQGGASFKERVQEDPEINEKLSKEQIESVFDMSRHLAHVERIFERAINLD
jgi:adenylosuccinate lyase